MGRPTPIIFAWSVRPMNALQLCRWQFSYKKLCSRLSSSEVRFYTKIGRFAFLGPPLGDLGATYDDHLRLIGKHVVDFLLVLIVLFFARCYGWGAAGEYRLKIGDFARKFQVEGVAPTNHSSSQKTRINAVSYDIKILRKIWIAWVGCTNVPDRQTTDGRTTTYSKHERSRSLKMSAAVAEMVVVMVQLQQHTGLCWFISWAYIIFRQ